MRNKGQSHWPIETSLNSSDGPSGRLEDQRTTDLGRLGLDRCHVVAQQLGRRKDRNVGRDRNLTTIRYINLGKFGHGNAGLMCF